MADKVKPIYTGREEQPRYAFMRKHFDQFYPNPVYSTAADQPIDQSNPAGAGR